MENLNNITEILTDDKREFRRFNRYDMETLTSIDGSPYTEDNNGILNTFAIEDDLLGYDEDDIETILNAFDDVEVRVLAGLLTYGFDWLETAKILEEGIIYFESSEWSEDNNLDLEAYEFLVDDLGLEDKFEAFDEDTYNEAYEIVHNDDKYEDYTETEKEYEVDDYYEIIKRDKKANIGHDFLRNDCLVIKINQGFVILNSNNI